jgi:hypothetical protein
MKPKQKTMMNAPRPCLLFFFLALQKTMMNAPRPCLLFFSCIAEDNDEHLNLLSSFITQGKKKKNTKNKKTMTSLPLLQPKKKNLDVGFSWVAGDDNKHPGLSSSFSLSSSLAKDDDS